MANVLLKQSAGKVPETSSLNLGEVAINTTDNISGSVHVTGSLDVSNYYYGRYGRVGSGSYWTSSGRTIIL